MSQNTDGTTIIDDYKKLIKIIKESHLSDEKKKAHIAGIKRDLKELNQDIESLLIQ